MILNKRVFCYILVYFINLSLTFSNQEKGSLSGVVTDEKNGQPLIGANVIISGTSIGSATDINGRYIIKNLDIGMIDLVITYIGYKKKTVKGIDISSLKSFEKKEGISFLLTSEKEPQRNREIAHAHIIRIFPLKNEKKKKVVLHIHNER